MNEKTEPVAWVETDETGRGLTFREVIEGLVISTRWHFQAQKPDTANPLWPVWAASPSSKSTKEADAKLLAEAIARLEWWEMVYGDPSDEPDDVIAALRTRLASSSTKSTNLSAEDFAILEAVRREMDEGDGNAPGHCHSIDGVWDLDNRADIAGLPCAWCLTWKKFTRLIEQGASSSSKSTKEAEEVQRLRGQFGVAVALLSECLGPLEVSAAVIESDDGDHMEALIQSVRSFVLASSSIKEDGERASQQFMVSSIRHKAGIVSLVTLNAEDVLPPLESGQVVTLKSSPPSPLGDTPHPQNTAARIAMDPQRQRELLGDPRHSMRAQPGDTPEQQEQKRCV